MGNLTTKTSGELASFMTPAKTNIKSLKVHFSPKQLGTGNPSPENVREIEGWDGVEIYNDPKYSGNIVWNQCFDLSTLKIGSGTSNNFNVTKLDTGFRVTTNTDVSGSGSRVVYFTVKWNRIQNHRYIFLCKIKSNTLKFSSVYFYHANGSSSRPAQNSTGQYAMIETYTGSTATTNASPRLYIYGIELSKDESFEVTDLMAVDLDIMFGTTVIDNLFNNTTTSLQRVDWFTSIITNYDYRDYNEGEITTVSAVNNESYTDLSINWTKNLLDIWLKPDGLQSVSYYNGNAGWSKEWIVTEELKGKTIIYSAFIDNTNASDNGYVHIWTKDIEGNYIKTNIKPSQDNQIIAGEFGWSNVKLTLTDNIYSVIFGITVTSNAIISYPMVELGLEQTEYQPYIGTIYGGYVDLISGELVEEWGMFTVDEPDSTWRVAAYNRITINFPRKYIFGSRLLKDKSMCTILPENHTNWNYGYIDNVASITNPHALSLNYTGNGEGWSELFGEEATNENVKEHLQEIGFAICATLATPITHQLTPTQLSSFIGQNNFWSNADYVEIEYDLIETIDIQKAKQKIMLNQPQLKTVSDKVVSFNTDMVAPLKNCKIYFNPIQLGSGNPSPTNIRDINGWTGLDSYVNGDKISVDWTNEVGTIYGGYLDLAKNEVVAEYAYISLSSLQWTKYEYITSGVVSYVFLSNVFNRLPTVSPYPSDIFCDVYTIHSTEPISKIKDIPELHICGRSTYSCLLIKDGRYETAEDFITNITGNVVYKLAIPIHYPLSSLTSQQLLTAKSTNHIWSETNGQQIDVKYWTHKNLMPIPLTNYLENQTWTDGAYISSTGKKTVNGTSASHFLTNQILLEAGTYVLSGFSHYVGTDNTNYRIHAYDSSGKWLRQITFQQIGNLSPVDISFTLDTDTYVNVSIAMDFDGVLAKIN